MYLILENVILQRGGKGMYLPKLSAVIETSGHAIFKLVL